MKQFFLYFILIFIIFTANSDFYAQKRGVSVKINTEQGVSKDVKLYDGSYALVIGASDYNYWNKLNGVKNDVQAVSQVLNKHGFEVEKLLNPTSENLLSGINKFVNKYGFQENNRILIYFAGHGFTEVAKDGRKFGYIVPTDAPNPRKDLIGFQRKAVTMNEVETVARRIRSKHALFIFDSCFSGSLVSRSNIQVPKVINYYATNPVRQFITAGADNQEVPDESIFRQMFVRGLDGKADLNKDKYITGTELATYLQEKVIYYRGELQTPQYGKIRDPRLDKGDFIFVASPTFSKTTKTADDIALQALAKFKLGRLEDASDLVSQALRQNSKKALALALSGHMNIWLCDECVLDVVTPPILEAITIEPKNKLFRAFLPSDPTSENRERAKGFKILPNPRNAMEFYARAELGWWSDQGNPVKDYDSAINLDANFIMAYFKRGLFKADGPNDAQGAYDDMTKVIDNLPDGTLIKGIAHYLRGQMIGSLKKSHYEAIYDYSKAIENIKKNTNVYLISSYNWRAKSNQKLKRYKEAISDYTTLINIHKSGRAFHYLNRAEVHFIMGNNNKTIADCTQAIEIALNPKSNQGISSRFYSLRAEAYEKLGFANKVKLDKQKAKEIYDRNTAQISSLNARPSKYGKKASKILYILSSPSNSNIKFEMFSIIFSEYNSGLFLSKLKEKGLAVITLDNLDAKQLRQYEQFDSKRNNSSLQSLPVALMINAVIQSMEDLPKYEGLFITKVSGYIEMIDTNSGKVLGIEKFTEVRGFGNTRDQARRNSLRSAAEGVSDSFLDSVKEKSR